MSGPQNIENDFLNNVTSVIEANISSEEFGVSELADQMNMSRSNLLRKVKKLTNLSVSLLIREVRLKKAMDLLQQSSFNVSEVSHQVGFGSTSYFIKCFREYYGYPPGEVGKRDESIPVAPVIHSNRKRNIFNVGLIVVLVLSAGTVLLYKAPFFSSEAFREVNRSIAFKNDSNDSTNVYFINGLMESTLNNLQKISELKVISRTSSEKYRNTSKSIPEMARELNVNYFIEGSGQKIGDQIVLNIQLIEASTDRHLWAQQYRRETKDVFQLQQEIAKSIAEEIQAIITPEEEKRIEKNPTENLVAYDFFLKGRESFYKGTPAGLKEALNYFNKAIEHDNQFALAYASVAIVYYYTDLFQSEKKYSVEINGYADKAFQYDSNLTESLAAKALSYAEKNDYQTAVSLLERALEYNPSSGVVINFLSDFYNAHVPNTAKYLEYALKGVRLNIGSQDSVSSSYRYLHLANALMQAGFINEAARYINKSLDYDPKNPFSGYLKVYIDNAETGDLKKIRELLIKELDKDTTRIDVIQEVAKINYYLRDYEGAYHYYKKFIAIRKSYELEIFRHENLKIAVTLSKLGKSNEAIEWANDFKQYADNDHSIYRNLNLAMYYEYEGNTPRALEYMKLFTKEDNFQYWVLLIDSEPIVDNIKNRPEFKKLLNDIETKFWNTHKRIKLTLEEKGLL